MIEEWKTTKTGLFRRDNNEFPHGLFDPAWKLSLCSVAGYLRGYFDKSEVKSDGETGELKRKTVISIDKHFIGKETTPLDDDSELIDEEDAVLTCDDLVYRGGDQNLRPLIEASIEVRRGKRLTHAEIDALKSTVEIRKDGTLAERYVAEPDAFEVAWRLRIKTWNMLCAFGKFDEISKHTGVSIDVLDYAARHGDNDIRMVEDPCEIRSAHKNFDWGAVRAAIDELSGRNARLAVVEQAKRQSALRTAKCKTTLKTTAALTAIAQFGYDAVENAANELASPTSVSWMDAKRRKAGIEPRYTPEMQLEAFIKEAKKATFDIFDDDEDPIERPAFDVDAVAAGMQGVWSAAADYQPLEITPRDCNEFTNLTIEEVIKRKCIPLPAPFTQEVRPVDPSGCPKPRDRTDLTNKTIEEILGRKFLYAAPAMRQEIKPVDLSAGPRDCTDLTNKIVEEILGRKQSGGDDQ